MRVRFKNPATGETDVTLDVDSWEQFGRACAFVGRYVAGEQPGMGQDLRIVIDRLTRVFQDSIHPEQCIACKQDHPDGECLTSTVGEEIADG